MTPAKQSGTTKMNEDKNEPTQSISPNAINHTALFCKPFCCCVNKMHPEVWLLAQLGFFTIGTVAVRYRVAAAVAKKAETVMSVMT
jgi:hypothetical protein